MGSKHFIYLCLAKLFTSHFLNLLNIDIFHVILQVSSQLSKGDRVLVGEILEV
jgi:hypothetical protein